MALKNTTAHAATSAEELISAISAYTKANPDHLRNPFTQGLQFADGEEISTFGGFVLQEWKDTADDERYGAYVCVVLNGKNYSLSSPTKTKLGTLLDKEMNPNKAEGAWSANGGLADLLRTLVDLDKPSLAKIEDFFLSPADSKGKRKPIARKMWVRWISTPRGGQSSLSNVL